MTHTQTHRHALAHAYTFGNIIKPQRRLIYIHIIHYTRNELLPLPHFYSGENEASNQRDMHKCHADIHTYWGWHTRNIWCTHMVSNVKKGTKKKMFYFCCHRVPLASLIFFRGFLFATYDSIRYVWHKCVYLINEMYWWWLKNTNRHMNCARTYVYLILTRYQNTLTHTHTHSAEIPLIKLRELHAMTHEWSYFLFMQIFAVFAILIS